MTTGSIYTSGDSGATWTEAAAAGSRYWSSITSSSDGTKLAAVAHNDYIYTSGDSGITWTEATAAGSRNWQSIASSSDGTKLAAVASGDYIYTSTDSGTTWTEQTSAGSRGWQSIASSSDGTKLAAVVYGGSIYTSVDSGATWTEQTSAGSRNWVSITSSSDGTKLASVAWGDHIYTSYIEQAPQEPSNHTILPNSEDSKSILLESPEDTTLTCSSSLKESTNTKQDTKYSYPLGLVDFCFDTTTQSNQVSLTFVTDLKPNQVVARKYNSTNGTYFDIPNATITETTLDGKHALKLTYNIEDNGTLDLDPATGSIKDPVGLAVLASEDDLASTGQSRATLLTMAIVSFIIGGFVLGRRAIGGGRA